MPGILPMKVIKVGTTAQSRIAQACDRCRSKKIRCDGVRPCCTQCANVGFECKTSDKLSRRAFPRGYTESLEDRVRALEAEVRELKDLLDEKDEKIDMLSRIHSFSASPRKTSVSMSPASSDGSRHTAPSSKEDVFVVRRSSKQSDDASGQNQLSGSATVSALVGNFNHHLQQTGRSPLVLPPSPFTNLRRIGNPNPKLPLPPTPPRLVSDALVNIYFQEWAPLFPVLHRPTLLRLYEIFTNDAADLQHDKHSIAELNLIFSIAECSSPSRVATSIEAFTAHWTAALKCISDDVSISTLQCLLLVQILNLVQGDHKSLLRYRAQAVDLCHQLDLHHDPKPLKLNALQTETRRKVFWCQYVLDRFTAALTGMPVLLCEDDIHTEYPVDIDDENVTEKGFLATLPGESTRLSSSLALFRATRILNRVLETLYSSKAEYEIALTSVNSLCDALEDWNGNLPTHLRLQFVQDKPSTNVTNNRSPFLSLVYYYIRLLIHRPVLSFAPTGNASASLLAIAESGKHIVQVLELLDERRMSFSFCLNKSELLFTSGIALLWRCSGLKSESKLVKDSRKLLVTISQMLGTEGAAGKNAFIRFANTIVPISDVPKAEIKAAATKAMPSPELKSKSPKKQLHALASRLSISGKPSGRIEEPPRRSTVPSANFDFTPPIKTSSSRASVASLRLGSEHPLRRFAKPCSSSVPNLDFFPLGNEGSPLDGSTSQDGALNVEDWERILAGMDSGQANIFNGIYGGQCADASVAALTGFEEGLAGVTGSLHPPLAVPSQDWSSDLWSLVGGGPHGHRGSGVARSVLSFSEESLTSGEDVAGSSSSYAPGAPENGAASYGGIIIPHDELDLNAWN